MTSWASTSSATPLPALGVLQAWVHRPQALARCTISDVYGMRALVKGNEGVEVNVGYSSRDVFMLNRFPCRMVELVGWVAGVDEKEKMQTIYLDDGDGKHVLPVTVRLPLLTIKTPSARPPSPQKSRSQTQTQTQTQHFIPAKERKAARKAALLESQTQAEAQQAAKAAMRDKGKEKEYIRNDVRVGDTVRVRGRIDEYRRGVEWVRVVVVETGTGGFAVDPEQQYHHLDAVLKLHKEVYSTPFVLPPTSIPVPISTLQLEDDTIFGNLDSTMPSSEMTSEVSLDSEQVKLCNPSKLRSSQLTDRTFRLYLLDHMSQETTRIVEDLKEKGELEEALRGVFPEYRHLLTTSSSQSHPRELTPTKSRTPLRSHSLNSVEDDESATPRPMSTTYPSKTRTVFKIPGFTITSILSIPHLAELADMVVEEQSRKEEKRRRRRMRDGTATSKDLQSRSQSMSMSMSMTVETQGSMKSQSSWRLGPDEKRARMERLVRWVIRGLSEEGVLVQIRMKSDKTQTRTDLEPIERSQSISYKTRSTHIEAYLPLPESLLLPLLIPHISAESVYRSKIYIPRSDPRYGHGVLLEDVLKRLRACGEEGRWERIGEYCVEDALSWGEGSGRGLKRVGRGWVLV